MGRPETKVSIKKPETKPIDEKEILVDEAILEYLSTKDDNYGNTNLFFKVSNPDTVDKIMKMNTKLPMWAGDNDDTLLKVKIQNVNSVLELERGHLYEAIINFVKYSFQPKDKNETMEGYTAKIMRLKEY
jgi:hypothetical protein